MLKEKSGREKGTNTMEFILIFVIVRNFFVYLFAGTVQMTKIIGSNFLCYILGCYKL